MTTISILKEVREDEQRVILSPKHVSRLSQKYKVLVSENAGIHIGFSNQDYMDSGAEIVSQEEAWDKGKLILKYKAPVVDEYKYIKDNQALAALLHAEGNPELLKELIDKRTRIFSFEYFRSGDDIFPLASPGGEIAGKMSVLYGLHFLQKQFGGYGRLLTKINGAEQGHIAVIGYGNVGGSALKFAHLLGNKVTVFGRNVHKMQKNKIFFDDNVQFLECTEHNLKKILPTVDLLIGAILISTFDTEAIITEEMIELMKPGTVIVDATCGYGAGYMPEIKDYTTLDSPYKKTKNGVIYCKIDNLPAAYPKTTAEAYGNNLIDWIEKLAEYVFDNKPNTVISNGEIIRNGEILNEEIRKHWKYYNVNISRNRI